MMRLYQNQNQWSRPSFYIIKRGVATLGVRVPQRAQPTYAETIRAALQCHIRTFDVDGEDDAPMAQALQDLLKQQDEDSTVDNTHPIEILFRLGYKNPSPNKSDQQSDPGDVMQPDGMVHNLRPDHLQETLETSKIVSELRENYPNKIKVTAMFQNPEVQCSGDATTPTNDRTQKLQDQLQHLTVQADVWKSTNLIDGYGILSHGLSLHSSHPMHLPLEALPLTNCSVLQFPVNVVERHGWTMVQQLRALSNTKNHPFPRLYAMRPLHVFPDNQGIPYKLVDYCLDDDKHTWTHTLTNLPDAYDAARKRLLSHLDAEWLREKQAKGESLSEQEEETLQVCTKLQELIHTMDNRLLETVSLLQHEDLLNRVVLPVLSQVELDEETANYLQVFFAQYNQAVRYSIARKVRNELLLLCDKNDSPKETVRLQEFALQRLLRQESSSFLDKIIVGTSRPDQVRDVTQIHAACDACGQQTL